jgi:hypothetical protein
MISLRYGVRASRSIVKPRDKRERRSSAGRYRVPAMVRRRIAIDGVNEI